MGMPNTLVLVRHGFSEGNFANHESRAGNHEHLLSPEYITRQDQDLRLMSQGVEQLNQTGQWITDNLNGGVFDMYLSSIWTRAIESSASLGLPNAEWKLDDLLRERDYGEIGSLSEEVFASEYPRNAEQKLVNPLYWCPPGGESISMIAQNRVRELCDRLHREADGKNVIVVTHGEFMQAVRHFLHRYRPDDFVEMKNDISQKTNNGSMDIYSRIDPSSGDQVGYLAYRRTITPWKETDTGWIEIPRNRYDNEQMLEMAKKVPRIFEE